MVDYIVERKEVYAGRLVKENGESYPILIKIDKDGLASDLLTVPSKKYQIRNEEQTEEMNKAFVENHFKLDKLLKHLGYGKELTINDLVEVFINIISNDEWLKRNMELFGWTKYNLGYVGGGVQVLPYELFVDLEDLNHSQHKQKEHEYIKINKGK